MYLDYADGHFDGELAMSSLSYEWGDEKGGNG